MAVVGLSRTSTTVAAISAQGRIAKNIYLVSNSFRVIRDSYIETLLS